MKSFLKKIIAFLNKIVLYFGSAPVDLIGNYFYFFSISASVGSNISFKKSSFIRTDISVLGNGNVVMINSANVTDSAINIQGDYAT